MIRDPRDRRFYELRKKDKSQLSAKEKDELVSYCEKLLVQKLPKKARQGWLELKNSLLKEN